MILIDFNQLIICNLLSTVNSIELTENNVRHLALSSVLFYRKKFHREYGEIVICSDGRNYWRKSYFPYYKVHRKDIRQDSKYDWTMIFTMISKILDEFKDFLPYKVLKLDKIEADDLIAVICKYTSSSPEKNVIISSDEDYLQLQKFKNVFQYSPKKKKFLKSQFPEKELLEKILSGDRGDGIPNVLSEDGSIALKIKQKTLSAKMKSTDFYKQIPEVYVRFLRNKKLIDFEEIPKEICDSIILEYNSINIPLRNKLLDYFVKNQLKNLSNSLGDF